MHSVSSGSWLQNPAQSLFVILGCTAICIVMLLSAILLRRLRRNHYLQHRDMRVLWARQNWEEIIRMTIPAESWLSSRVDREIVEEILFERIEAPGSEDPAALRLFAAQSGLLNRRIWEVNHLNGSGFRRSLLALGRMRNPAGIPALVDAMRSNKRRFIVEAICSLGMIGSPQAAEPILELLQSDVDCCPPQSLQIALVNCFRRASTALLEKTMNAGDELRPLLARVLAEVANSSTSGDLLSMTGDPLAEVRACAARVLAAVRPPYARPALMQLACDQEWFVRLRAVVGLGELKDREGICVLVKALCDPNRLVRLRAAAALVQLEGEESNIFQFTVETGDRYALQALVSEMERSGRIAEMASALSHTQRRQAREAALQAALRGGAEGMLLDLWLHHPEREVRMRLGRLLAASSGNGLLQRLDQHSLAGGTRHQGRMLRWLSGQLHQRQADAASDQGAVA